MRRSSGEQKRQFAKVDAVSLFEREFASPVLLKMVITTEADRPAIRRFEGDTPIRITADVSTLDRTAEAARNTAVMAAHPGTVSRTLAAVRLARLPAVKPVRKL